MFFYCTEFFFEFEEDKKKGEGLKKKKGWCMTSQLRFLLSLSELLVFFFLCV